MTFFFHWEILKILVFLVESWFTFNTHSFPPGPWGMKSTVFTKFQAAWIWHSCGIVHFKPISVVGDTTASELEGNKRITRHLSQEAYLRIRFSGPSMPERLWTTHLERGSTIPFVQVHSFLNKNIMYISPDLAHLSEKVKSLPNLLQRVLH